MLKNYQTKVVQEVQEFFTHLDTTRSFLQSIPVELRGKNQISVENYISMAFGNPKYEQFPDRPKTGAGNLYPRVCIKMPTGGGKTLVAVETIRTYQNLFAKKKTGLVVWITHREQIYRQTIENLQNKSHLYRQLLDQCSGNRTIILEKGQPIRKQDTDENLVVLMLMIQSATKDTNKIFEDSGGYTDFFPEDNRYDLHHKLLQLVPNLDTTEKSLFDQMQVKTSLGNVIRTQNPLIIVDELHTMFTDNAKTTLDGLNPSAIIGLSATPKRGMNILVQITGKELKDEDMIKLDMHLIEPAQNGDWRVMLASVKKKREQLERKATKLEQNKGTYIRPIALIQVERTGKEQRGQGFVHSEDVREFLIDLGVPKHEIAVKSSSLDEIKQQKLLSKESEVRYIITKEALKEGWDCSFAYILGVIPNAHSNSSMTQLVGRILRQPYAKKTGVADLDESYVFFASGHTQEVLEKVKKGFEEEGLGDITIGISQRNDSDEAVNPVQVVPIRKEIKKKYAHSLFLPVWLMKEAKKHRKFVYEIDVKPKMHWDDFDVEAVLKEIIPTIGTARKMQKEIIVDLEGNARAETSEATDFVSFDTLYLTRRLSETIDNAFISHDIAQKVVAVLLKKLKKDLLDQDAGYIASEIEKRLITHKKKQEHSVFDTMVHDNKLILAVSDDDKIGFSFPDNDIVSNTVRSAYRLTLYDDVDIASLNTLEREVVKIIEESPNVIWWVRNKPVNGWYAVQGWQRGKIRPDFVVARKNDANELEFVYVVESKGEQLVGNTDTEYKSKVFERMNDMRGKIEKLQFKTTTIKLNDKFEFELVAQNEEELRIRTKLNV